MSLFAIIGWIMLGAAVTACLVTFWDEIRIWLNNTAADAVEKVLGYGARERMHRAIAKIDKVINKLKNKTVIYTKKTELEAYYDKTTIVSEAPLYEINSEVIEEINKQGTLVQEFEYRGAAQ
jgi:hypothetical protein